MQITKTIRRGIGTVLLSAGLAYPACAAVCPKGIGGCTAPGRCFLFVDADTNSLCDYTGRTSSSGSSGSIPSRSTTTQQATATPAADPTAVVTTTTDTSATQTVQAAATETASTTIDSTAHAASTGSFPLVPAIAEIVLFLLFTGIIFALVRRGALGIRTDKTIHALALSSFFGLALSLIATCVILGDTAAGTTYALVWAGGGTLLAAYLWYAGMMTRRVILGAAAVATIAGFVFIAPVMPLELGGVVNVVTGASAATMGVIVICSLVAMALITGRAFCGNICPVGSLQELAYAVPVRKVTVRRTEFLELVRLAVFLAAVTAAIYFIDIMALTGLYDLFALTMSTGFVIAAVFVLVSVFVYRPVCRILCPFGVIFSVLSEFSMFRLRRTESCISCKKCEVACPVRTAGKNDSKRECYLCGRCTEACPADDAIAYSK